MDMPDLDKAPRPEESLGNYLRRVRKAMNLTQEEVASAGGLHKQTLLKIEAGKSSKLSKKTRQGLVYALKIPEEYLNAFRENAEALPIPRTLKICPKCWQVGTRPETQWLDLRSKYCFLCGGGLRDRCDCGQTIADWRYAFCPYCGKGLATLR
ncbi:helix-turn-helix domain-containing protein [Pannus brasiliensis CCIBt3594]|uniref:Helix-turn-helix domain-containing protein n=2 Tax=Pannus TaxID=1427526 RepID=A0AAW9QWU4_9CHRO